MIIERDFIPHILSNKSAEIVDTDSFAQLPQAQYKREHFVEFITAIKKKIRDVYFIYHGGRSTVLVCIPNYPLVLCEVYMDSDRTYRPLYCVRSDKINNLRGERDVKSSVHTKQGVINVGKYGVKVMYASIVNAIKVKFDAQFFKHYGGVDTALKTARKLLFRDTPPRLENEILALHEKGYRFENPEVRDALREIDEKTVQFENRLAELPMEADIYIGIPDKQMQISTCMSTSLKRCFPDKLTGGFTLDNDTPLDKLTVNDISIDAKNAMASLDITDEMTYVEGVGIKLMNGLYVLERY